MQKVARVDLSIFNLSDLRELSVKLHEMWTDHVQITKASSVITMSLFLDSPIFLLGFLMVFELVEAAVYEVWV